MSEKSPAYLWYPSDIDSSGRVRSLTDLEELWYRRALDQSWMHEGVPSDAAEFAGWIGRNCTKESAAKLLKMFFTPTKKDPSKSVNERQEKERKKLREKSKLRKEAGRLSGVKRREKRDLGSEQMFNKTEAKPNIPIPTPIPKNEEEETHITAAVDWDFPVKQLIEAFPNMDLTPAAIGFIEAAVKAGDETAWAATIDHYKMNFDPSRNRYLPEKTANLLGVFKTKKTDLEKTNGSNTKHSGFSNKRTDADVISESADFYDNYPS